MRRYRALLGGTGTFVAAQFSAGCTTNMSGFDLRQAHQARCLHEKNGGLAQFACLPQGPTPLTVF